MQDLTTPFLPHNKAIRSKLNEPKGLAPERDEVRPVYIL